MLGEGGGSAYVRKAQIEIPPPQLKYCYKSPFLAKKNEMPNLASNCAFPIWLCDKTQSLQRSRTEIQSPMLV